MGAVFALYSAWYFWIPKILGVDYNRSWGKVHFWILFIGVNVTFFPQHFLGLQGMPRRISDYADAFAGWNMISSFGSIISVTATFLFLHALYIQLTEGKPVSGYVWHMPSYYTDALQAISIRSFDSLEWALSSPPKPHAFVSLPVQSGLPPRRLDRLWAFIKQIWVNVCTKKFIFSFIIVFLTGFTSRYIILNYFHVDVFTDIFDKSSIIYYTGLSIYIRLVGEIMTEWFKPSEAITMMASNRPTAGGNPPMGGANVQPAPVPTGGGSASGNGGGSASGNGRGSMAISYICNTPGPESENLVKIRPKAERPTEITRDSNGKLQHPYETLAEQLWDGTIAPDAREGKIGRIPIYDPKNQNFNYRVGGPNQPLAECTASSLENLREKGFKLHEHTLDTIQKEFLRNVLQHEDQEMYDKIYTNKRGRPLTNPNWKAADAELPRIIDKLRRAR